MFSKLIVLTIFIKLVIITIDGGKKTRIYYGEDADIQDYPYMALVGNTIRTDNASLCAGTIIHRKFVLTAAKCISKCTCIEELEKGTKIIKCGAYACEILQPNTVWIRTGLTRLHLRMEIQGEAKRLIIHPSFNGLHSYDIGLIKLKVPIDISYKQGPQLRLPRPGDVLEPNVTAFTLGWGLTDKPTNNVLQRVNLKILTNVKCQWYLNLADSPLEDVHVCARYTGDICFGDTGAPLVYNHTLHGVATSPVGVDCETELPSLFIRLPQILDWLVYNLVYL